MILGATLGAASLAEVLLFSFGWAIGGIIVDLLVSAMFTLTFYRAHRSMRHYPGPAGHEYRGGYKRAAVLATIMLATVIPILFGGPYAVLGTGLVVAGLIEREFLAVLWGLVAGIIGAANNYYAPLLHGIQANIERPVVGLALSVIMLAIGYAWCRLRDRSPC